MGDTHLRRRTVSDPQRFRRIAEKKLGRFSSEEGRENEKAKQKGERKGTPPGRVLTPNASCKKFIYSNRA